MTLSSKAQWHTFFLLILNCILLFSYFLRLVFILLIFTSEELLLLLMSLVLRLSIWVRLGLVLLLLLILGRLLAILLLLRVILRDRLLLLLLLLFWSICSHKIQTTINYSTSCSKLSPLHLKAWLKKLTKLTFLLVIVVKEIGHLLNKVLSVV